MLTGPEARRVVQSVRKEIEAARGTYIWRDYVNALNLVSQTVFTRSSGFILEMLQNAEDAGWGLDSPGVVEIAINAKRLRLSHNGRRFSEEDVKALCGIRSSKKPEQGTLGYLGIGFKSVFKVTDRPEIYSGAFQFKFDRNHPEWDDPARTPWQILPLWADEPSEQFDPDKTTFIIAFNDEAQSGQLLRELEGLRTGLYLFLRWLKRVEVADQVSGDTWVLENLGENKEGITTLSRNGEEERFRFFRRTCYVPDAVKQDRLTRQYRPNVTQREVTIALPLDSEGNLSPSPAGAMYGGVYSFLPLTEESSGAKFRLQADFLVQPGREAVHYEARWNHWLVQEVAVLCREAIDCLKKHERWKCQVLQAFAFTKSTGNEAYEKLFGPKLIEPVEAFLDDDLCVPTADGGWTTPRHAVVMGEKDEAVKDLVTMGVLGAEEVAPAMGGTPDLQVAHAHVVGSKVKPLRKVDRWDLLKNEALLEEKTKGAEAGKWFRSLYLWLQKHPAYEDYFHYKPRVRVKGYHDCEIVLTASAELFKGGQVYVLDIARSDPILREVASELQAAKPLLHPDILGGADGEKQDEELRGFLRGLAGVQVLDTKVAYRDLVLPKILTGAPEPSRCDLLKWSGQCKEVLGAELGGDVELWVLTKSGDVRAAKETLLSKEFRPERDWETLQQYVPGLSFVDPVYVVDRGCGEGLRTWRQFFAAGGVKEEPDNGVEDFAMNYAEQKMRREWGTTERVEKRNFGYDLEVQTSSRRRMVVEVKGQTKEADVELTGNETEAAGKYGDSFYVCVVCGIPENPSMCLVENPCAPGVGKFDKLTIPVEVWKTFKLDVGT